MNTTKENIDYIWSILETYDDEGLASEEDWDDICTVMAWIQEDLGLAEVADGT